MLDKSTIFLDTECDKTMIGDAERSKLQVGYKQAVRALNENKASKYMLPKTVTTTSKTE